MTSLLRPSLLTLRPLYTTLNPPINPINLTRPSIHSTLKMTTNYSTLPTPTACYADFCLIPVGTGSLSVAKEIAEVQRLLEASGLKYTMHSAGTTVEGSWDDVFKVIGQAHALVHKTGAQRVQTSMRVGTRTDKSQTAEDKVKRVKDILAGSKA